VTSDGASGGRELVVAIEAAVLLTLVRIGLTRLRFERVARLVGLRPGEAGGSADPVAAARVGDALRRAAGWVPFEATCLVQALAGARMLRRRHVAATVRVGVSKDQVSVDGFAAHAWLHTGEIEITGGEIAGQYTPLAAYRTSSGSA
jgi:hypothetical protein